MIYLFWSLLNIGLLIWFLLISITVLKLIYKNMGLAATMIYLIGTSSFTQSSIANNQNNINDEQYPNKVIAFKNLQDEKFFSLDLTYSYSSDTLARKKVQGVVTKTGLVMGHDWKPILIYLERENGEIRYVVTGFHEWKLLGLTIYHMPQEYKGILKMK